MQPISDKKLWDSCGNYCRITLYHLDGDLFELWLHDFNQAVPERVVDTLGICMNKGEIWLSQQKAKGFEEQLPSYTPNPIN